MYLLGVSPSQCSKSCGGGTRRRRAMCVNTYNDVLDDSKCSQQEKLTVQRCSDFSCPQWKTGDWSEVGAGHQRGLILRGWCLERDTSVPAHPVIPCIWFVLWGVVAHVPCRSSLCTGRLETGSKVTNFASTHQVAISLPTKPQSVNSSPILQ